MHDPNAIREEAVRAALKVIDRCLGPQRSRGPLGDSLAYQLDDVIQLAMERYYDDD